MRGPDARTIAVVLGTLNVALASFGGLANFATVEEGRQLPAGLAQWKSGNFRLAADTMPLPRMLAVLPCLPIGPRADLTFSEDSYQRYPGGIDAEIRQKFYEKNIANYDFLIFLARSMNLLWWVAGAWLVWRWSAGVWGGRGWLGLTLWCFTPNVLALEMLATPDLAAGVAFSASAYTFWRWLRSPSWTRAMITSVFLGLASLTDFACLSLYLILPASLLILGTGPGAGLAKRLSQMAVMFYVGISILNLGYGISGTGKPLGDFGFTSRSLGGIPAERFAAHEYARAGNRFGTSGIGAMPAPFPTDFMYGLDLRQQGWERANRPAKDDRSRPDAWGQDPLRAAAARIPLGIWALLVCSAVPTIRSICREGRSSPASYLAFIVLAGSLVLAQGHMLTGPKSYILALLPAFVLVDGLAGWVRDWRVRGLVVGLAAWTVLGGLLVYPQCLHYLNEFAGGTNSIRAQVEYASFADCGLDIMRVRDWAEAHRSEWPVGVSCTSTVDLRAFAIKPTRPPIDPGADRANSPGYTRAIGPSPGVFAVDAYDISMPQWRYFLELEPTARLGPTTMIYRTDRESADAVRRRIGIPPLPPSRTVDARGGEGGFVHKVYRDKNGQSYNYAVFVPKVYLGERTYPLIMMLHGYGDRGFDGRRFLKVGLPRAVDARKDSFSFFVICPEGHEGNWAEGEDDARIVMEILERTIQDYSIDRKRLYLTGVSSGAGAVWRFAARRPDLWAAIAPIATSACDPRRAALLKDMPVWCFHNFNDEMSPPDIPRRMIDALEAAGGRPRYTEFVVLTDEEERTDPRIRKHNAWTKAYATEALYDWFLENRRR